MSFVNVTKLSKSSLKLPAEYVFFISNWKYGSWWY